MKRALLIAGGTVGGLGAVLAITPPQLSSTSSVSDMPGASIPTAATPSATSTPKATSTPRQSTKPTSKATTSSKPTTKAPTPAAVATTPAAPVAPPAGKNVNGTFTGSAVDVGYGTVQVKITVVNGKITDAQAVQAPNGRNDRYTNMSVPVLRQRTLTAQSANINGVSGASYTSYGWYTSLVVALKQAGL